MSERRFVDPMTSSFREERFIINFGKKLLSGNEQGANGVFYRLGVITYARTLIEGRLLPENLKDEYDTVISNDKEYLKDLLEKRLVQDRSILEKAYSSPVPSVQQIEASTNWDRLPNEKFPAEYVRHLFSESERETWINELIEAYEDEDNDDESYASSDVLGRFVKEYFSRRDSDENKPSRMLSHNEVRKVLHTWADSLRGFDS